MFVSYASHAGNGISHTPQTARVGLTLVVLIGAAAATALSGGGAIAIIISASTWGGRAMSVATIIDKYSKPAVNEYIATGLESVRLGPGIWEAALAMWPRCVGDRHHLMMKEGSKTVVLGPGLCPMSRREDVTVCGGTIAEGLETVLVGGEPSSSHAKGDEASDPALTALKLSLIHI